MDKANITGVILAGGKASRMGGTDKGLVPFSGHPMIEYIIAAVRPQVATLLINANRNIEHYKQYGYPVVPDHIGGYQGPLAGMAGCMAATDTDYILTLPCDSPCVSDDLVSRLATELQARQAEICTAHDGDRLQPVFALLHTGLLTSLEKFLADGNRKIDKWYAQHKLAVADFSDCPETFSNINTPADISELEARVLN
ncbi:MAG: molybdenum cofactor guanylyltransferase MobA [Gammaproteobacteria bacterium]